MAAYTGNHCIIPSTEPEDFVNKTETLTFQPGENCVCFNTTVIDDDIALEGDEQFRVIFGQLNGATVGDVNETCVTIPDNDGRNRKPCLKTTESHVLVFVSHTVPEVEFKQPDYVAPEEEGGVEVCVRLNTNITQPLTIEVIVTTKPASTNPAGLVEIWQLTLAIIASSLPQNLKTLFQKQKL